MWPSCHAAWLKDDMLLAGSPFQGHRRAEASRGSRRVAGGKEFQADKCDHDHFQCHIKRLHVLRSAGQGDVLGGARRGVVAAGTELSRLSYLCQGQGASIRRQQSTQTAVCCPNRQSMPTATVHVSSVHSHEPCGYHLQCV